MVPGFIRTVVPVVVGAFIAWVMSVFGVDITEYGEAITGALIVVLTGAWYVLFRFLERNISPRWGWLLGLADQPIYGEEVAAIEPNSKTPKTVAKTL